MKLVIETSGDVQIERELVRFSDRAVDLSPAFERIIDRLERAEAKQFQSEGAYGSAGWEPLAESTLQRKGGRGSILVDTGDLRDSLTGDGSDALREVLPSSMVFGSSVPYAKFHQTGTGRMPRRRPLEIPERDRRDLPKIIQQHIVRGDRAAGALLR